MAPIDSPFLHARENPAMNAASGLNALNLADEGFTSARPAKAEAPEFRNIFTIEPINRAVD